MKILNVFQFICYTLWNMDFVFCSIKLRQHFWTIRHAKYIIYKCEFKLLCQSIYAMCTFPVHKLTSCYFCQIICLYKYMQFVSKNARSLTLQYVNYATLKKIIGQMISLASDKFYYLDSKISKIYHLRKFLNDSILYLFNSIFLKNDLL